MRHQAILFNFAEKLFLNYKSRLQQCFDIRSIIMLDVRMAGQTQVNKKIWALLKFIANVKTFAHLFEVFVDFFRSNAYSSSMIDMKKEYERNGKFDFYSFACHSTFVPEDVEKMRINSNHEHAKKLKKNATF